MRILLRGGIIGLAVLGCGWLLLRARGEGEDKEIRDGVLKIAAALEKGDTPGAKTQAKAVAKKVEEAGDVMDLLNTRKKMGFGVGPKPAAITPDGIEQMIMSIARDGRSPAKVQQEAKALEEMGYRIAAIMEVALEKAPEKDMGTKTKKLWLESAQTVREAALKLAVAAREKNASELKTAAAKANTGCNNCHSEFK